MSYTLTIQSLQDLHWPDGRCFGCGPANEHGLRIKSFVDGDELICDWQAEPYHLAFEGALNGGIIGTLLDCHSNWTAAWHLKLQTAAAELPNTVTADYHVFLKRITPITERLRLRARVVESHPDRAIVEATLVAGGKVTASCRGTFVAVKEGHPAYHRWR